MITVRIVTPHGLYKETETSILNVVTSDGARGILPNHVPVVTMLKTGVLNLKENGQSVDYYCGSGLLYYRDNLAEIMTDQIASKEEIDCTAVEAEKAALEKELAELEKSGTKDPIKLEQLKACEVKLQISK